MSTGTDTCFSALFYRPTDPIAIRNESKREKSAESQHLNFRILQRGRQTTFTLSLVSRFLAKNTAHRYALRDYEINVYLYEMELMYVATENLL